MASPERWQPDPRYAEYPEHGLHDVPLALLEAGRAAMAEAARYGDVDPELADALADAVVMAVMPAARAWLRDKAA